MSTNRDDARELLKRHGLRSTAPRLAVLRVLAASTEPLSYREVHHRLGVVDWDPTTIYRNLVKLRDAGIAPVVSRMEGIDRYALASRRPAGGRHAHFLCEDCGRFAWLPPEVIVPTTEGPWSASLRSASVQLRGTCPQCLP